jgi:ABC-type transport system involved in cytochrome bd biosynthesis fused ATPase/permease subunit
MKLIAIFGASLSATYLLIRVNRQNYAKYAEQQQSSANDFSSSLLRGWDSLVVGNKINKRIFYTSLREAQKKFEKSTMQACLFDQRQSIGIAVISAIPTILHVIFQIMQSQDKAIGAAALASLPRVFQIISSSHTVFSGFSQWQGYQAKFNFIESNMPKEDFISSQKSRVTIENIKIENEGRITHASSIEDAVTKFTKSGRYTITGSNGAGKSSILKLLKTHLKDEAFYLPAKHQLLFQADLMQGSSGERTRRQIEEALTDQYIKVLLLDEWDANLDTVNTKTLDEKIQGLIANKIVIEVRHKTGYQEV